MQEARATLIQPNKKLKVGLDSSFLPPAALPTTERCPQATTMIGRRLTGAQGAENPVFDKAVDIHIGPPGVERSTSPRVPSKNGQPDGAMTIQEKKRVHLDSVGYAVIMVCLNTAFR